MIVCVGSTQQQAPHEKAPQPPEDQNRVGRGDGAGAVPGARPDVGRRLTGRAAHHHVLHRQDHQVSSVRCYFWVSGFKVAFFLFLFVFLALFLLKNQNLFILPHFTS